ncbi:hypothetical protein OXX79_007970 [Metschnikowia pulcherrima]
MMGSGRTCQSVVLCRARSRLYIRNFFPTLNSPMMGLWQKWTSLPVKIRYYIGGSTMIFALIGDYATTQINEEIVNRKKIMEEIEDEARS